MHLSRIGPFALEEPLDRSANSNVLRGVHVERQVSVAIKLLPSEVAQQAIGTGKFAGDIKRLQRLEHHGWVRVLGGAVEQGQPYLVQELVSGESLRELLNRRVRLPWEMAIEIVDNATQALMYAHANGYSHQRLTPARILLPPAGGVKLLGLDCKWADRDEVVAGSCALEVAHYLSPEQFRGRQSASFPQCDLFSLGVILYECLTGELPWPADSVNELRQARRDAPAPRISTKVLDCPVWLDVLADKLLAKVRSERLQTAEETHRAIVIAKRKADAGTGAAQQAFSGKQGTLAVKDEQGELRRIRAQKTRERDDSPFYERAWFLALCLSAVIGAGVWALWPPNEAKLFASAKPLMESDDPVDWKRAQEQFLKPLMERFPETSHAQAIAAFNDRYDLHRAEERIKNLGRFSRQPQSEVEGAIAEAWEHQRMGDRMTAWQKYESVIELFQHSIEKHDLVYVKLARQQIERIKSDQGPLTDVAAFLEQQLSKARALADLGELLEARRTLDSIISLYASNQELRPLVERARRQLSVLDAGTNP
ncbi:MAG: serine/threonine-protein kinase [Planctomycetota bacterium]